MLTMRFLVVLALIALGAQPFGVGALANPPGAQRGNAALSDATPDAPSAARHPWPSSGRVTYEVLRGEGGLKLGEARHRWQHDGERYTMSTEVETTGLAGMLYSFRYVQHSEGRVGEGGLQPERFRVEQAGKAPETAHFDWAAGKVVIERRGRRSEFPIAANDQDVLSVWHLAGRLNGRALPAELTLVTNRVAAPASLEVLGRERLTVPSGEVEALRLRVRARSGKLTIELWLSERHHFVPVRILMTDDKGEVLDQRAIGIALDGR